MIYVIGIETAFILWIFYMIISAMKNQAETIVVAIKEDGIVRLQDTLEFPNDNLDWLPEGLPQRVTLIIEHLD